MVEIENEFNERLKDEVNGRVQQGVTPCKTIPELGHFYHPSLNRLRYKLLGHRHMLSPVEAFTGSPNSACSTAQTGVCSSTAASLMRGTIVAAPRMHTRERSHRLTEQNMRAVVQGDAADLDPALENGQRQPGRFRCFSQAPAGGFVAAAPDPN